MYSEREPKMADSPRNTREGMLIGMALLTASRSTCSRLGVGAVISREGRIISTGYNGAPAGFPHCTDDSHFQGVTCRVAVHAEANAIVFAARYGVSTLGAEMHVTHMPCASCARLIINAGIRRVVYRHEYRDPEGVVLLKLGGVEVEHTG